MPMLMPTPHGASFAVRQNVVARPVKEGEVADVPLW